MSHLALLIYGHVRAYISCVQSHFQFEISDHTDDVPVTLTLNICVMLR